MAVRPVYPSLVREVEQPSVSSGGFRRTVWTYDSLGNATTRTEEGVENGSAFSLATVTTYNVVGQPSVIDPAGYGPQDRTRFAYDPARGHLVVTSRSGPLLGARHFGYDAFNRRTSVTEVNGVVTETSYDALDRVVESRQKGMTLSEDLVTTRVYNVFGDLLRAVLPEGNVIEYGYDGAGRLTSLERKPSPSTPGERALYALDAFGNRIREDLQSWTGSAWQTESFTGYEYSNRCNLDKVLHADGTVTEFAYDCKGYREREWDANHPSAGQQNPATASYAYDALDRLTSITRPWGGAGDGTVVSRYEYNVQDHLVKVVDGNGTVTEYIYSDRDLLTQETSEVSGVRSFVYNEHGQLIRETDGRGVMADRVVDALDRVRFVDYPENAVDTTYVYDDPAVPFSQGRLSSVRRDGESVEYGYDRFGRLTQDGALSYSYDKNGNRLSIGYPGGVTATYTYDFADRQATLVVQDGTEPVQTVVQSSRYKPSGPLTELTLGNGLVETHDFDNRYFPTSIRVGDLLNWTYTTDAVGNILGIVDELEPDSSRVYTYQNYQYFLTASSGPWGDLAWSYDKLSNRLSETRDGATTLYTYIPNAAGQNSSQLATITSSGGGATRYFYDAGGNLTHESRDTSKVRYIYNAAGRLSEILRDKANRAPSMTKLRYDGRRSLSRSTLTPFLGMRGRDWVTRVTYSSEGVLHHRAIERHPTLESPRGERSTQRDDYVLYFSGRPAGMLRLEHAPSQQGSLLFLSVDTLGTPILAAKSNSELLWLGGFGPFGEDVTGAEEAGVFLRFPGQWYDETWMRSGDEPSLYYNLNRWYQPESARYSRPDPLGISADVNLYRYAISNPLTFIDPDGREPGARTADTAAQFSQDFIRTADCVLKFATEAENRGRKGLGWPWAHCWASCTITRFCGGEALARTVGLGKEFLDVAKCLP